MDEVINTIKKNRNITESTLNTYKRHLNKILKMAQTEDITILENPKKIIDLLINSESSPSSIRAYLASLVVYMDTHGKNADEYRKVMNEYIQKEKEKNNTHEKTETQKQNWTTLKELQDVVQNYEDKIKKEKITKREKLNKKENELFQKYILGMLYVGDVDKHPPIRLDYSPMKIITEEEYIKNYDNKPSKINYLVIKSRNKKYFAFHNYKTIKTHGIKKIPISQKINTALNKYLKYTNEYLFENNQNRPLSSNALGKLITKTFEPTGKKISVNMLRHIFISEKYPPEKIKEQQKDASNMFHSTDTQKIYSKD